MSTSIWNLTHPLRSGHITLKKGGSELFGTVIRHGKNKKTVTVLVSKYVYNKKIGFWGARTNKFHCHDEDEYCRSGDKVIIKHCRKLSPIKNFYVRNIVLPVGRVHQQEKDFTQYEKDAIKYNEELRENTTKIYF